MEGSNQENKQHELHERVDAIIDWASDLHKDRPRSEEGTEATWRLLAGALEINTTRLQSIHYLVDYGNEFSDPATTIMRSMLEDAATIEWIFQDVHDEEIIDKYVAQFFDFRWIQAKQDLDYFRSTVGDLESVRADFPEKIKEIESEYARVLHEHKSYREAKKGNPNAWIPGKGVEAFIRELETNNGDSDRRLDMMKRAYQLGNRTTHFNADNILEVLQLEDDKYHGVAVSVRAHELLILGGMFLLWIIKHYMEWTPPTDSWGDVTLTEGKIFELDDYLAESLASVTRLVQEF